jgi:hypothetical protein
MNITSISITLLVASLVLLIIYGADVATTFTTSQGEVRGTGFLPFNEEIRGIIFGAIPVILSIIAFVVVRKVTSKAVSILLFVNGGLIIVGILVTMTQAGISSEDTGGMQRTVGFTIALGVLLIALGVSKAILDKRAITNQRLS